MEETLRCSEKNINSLQKNLLKFNLNGQPKTDIVNIIIRDNGYTKFLLLELLLDPSLNTGLPCLFNYHDFWDSNPYHSSCSLSIILRCRTSKINNFITKFENFHEEIQSTEFKYLTFLKIKQEEWNNIKKSYNRWNKQIYTLVQRKVNNIFQQLFWLKA